MAKPMTNGQLASYLEGKFEGLERAVTDLAGRTERGLGALETKIDSKVDKTDCAETRTTLTKRLNGVGTGMWANKVQIAAWTGTFTVLVLLLVKVFVFKT